MITTAMLLDFPLTCPHCQHIAWACDARRLSRTEYEWECTRCERLAYWEDIPG